MNNQPRLPPKWRAVWSNSKNAHYYYNEETGASTWRLPPGTVGADPTPAPPRATDGEASSSGEGMTLTVAADSDGGDSADESNDGGHSL